MPSLFSLVLDMPFDCLSLSQDLSTESVPSLDFSLFWINHLAQIFCGCDSLFGVKWYSSLLYFWVDSLQCDRQHAFALADLSFWFSPVVLLSGGSA